MIIKGYEMISRLPEDSHIIFLQNRPHNFKLFCVLNRGGVPYMVLVGFDGKHFYQEKSAPFAWARDLMIPAEENSKRYKNYVPYFVDKKAASDWYEMLVDPFEFEVLDERNILEEFITRTGEYLNGFINCFDKITPNIRRGLTEEETWIESVVQFAYVCRMLAGENYDYVCPENLKEIYREGEIRVEFELLREECLRAYQSGDVKRYETLSRKYEAVLKKLRDNM